MEPDQWDSIVELFHAAREKIGGERLALLDSLCGGDQSLRALIEQMLRDDEATGSFLDRPPIVALAAASRRAPTAVGARFGRYEIVAPIGLGGMGEVWIGRDTELGRQVALKFLAPEAVFSNAEGLTREAMAASALNHPNIVTVHEVIRHEDTRIIVMELVEGTALRAVSGSPQPLDRVIHFGLQIARALAVAHASGLVHCDIKPENILVRPDGYIKVVDFGLAHRVAIESIGSGSGPPAGTLRYMSPEQAHGESLTPASDVFSFGLVLYELATGRHAFPGASALEAVDAILNQQPAAPLSVNPGLPARLDRLITGMLAKDPVARPGMEDVAQALTDLERIPEAQRVSFRAARLATWLLLCALLAGGGFAIWRWRFLGLARNQPAFYQMTTLVPENRATAAAISPDGSLIAYANVDGVFVRAKQNGKTSALRGPRDFVVDRVAWFSDSKKLVASGFSKLDNAPGIWTISVTGEPARMLREDGREAVPSPDGTRIAFIGQDRSEIWVMRENGEQPRRVVSGPGQDTFPLVFWSPDGRRLAYQRRHYAPKRPLPSLPPGKNTFDLYYERSYESVDLETGRRVSRAADMWIASAAALPDGRILFLRWYPLSADYSDQLWEVKTDLATGAFREAPRKIASPIDAAAIYNHISTISATADGQQVLVLRESDQNSVFIGDFAPAGPRIENIRRLTFDDHSNYPHAWTADSRAVIFESNRNGNYDLFKQDAGQRTPETIVATPANEIMAQMDPDGRWLLYMAQMPDARRLDRKLMRVPVEGGRPEEVPIGGPLDEFQCALRPGKRCVLRTTVQAEYYVFYELSPLRGRGRELARTAWTPEYFGDWSVSPDGKYVAIPNHDSRDARIREVNLEPDPGERRERDVVLAGLTDLRGLVWAPDGRSWFVSVDTTVGSELMYVYRDGRFRLLGDIQGWAVPSPDGRRVAFPDRIVATNAWMIDRR